MTANPNKVREIFLAALKLGPEKWDSHLTEACGGDELLRDRVRNLLAAHREAGSFLEPAVAGLDVTTDEPASERSGTMIGPYKLLEQIGEGGFGIVYMAEQMQPVRRRVALKVLKPGMDTRQVVARFEAERQALALMDHPHIAHVFDGGETPAGRPYFVMELVRGVPITDFCDQTHRPVRERLELFVSVCQAVQHAHQKGIIHRDLKPTNVLVTMHDDKPVAKVIDFGIAKATGQQLTEMTLFTNFAQMIGTPLYMSPEQAQMSGLDVDTRSDIYSLGVLLYELLTGTTPFDQERFRTAAYDEIRRIIREEEPAKPSTRLSTPGQAAVTASANRDSDPRRLSQLFRGELDWIVMKALEKDRNRRYETASSFAADVGRYLRDDPVQACQPTASYRFRKFARRNKTALGTAATIGLGTLAGMVMLAVSNVLISQKQRETTEALAAETKAKGEAQDAVESERHSLYFQRIARANLEWWNNNVGRADQILDECPEEYRRWEWRYVKRLCHDELLTLKGHYPFPVRSVAFSPDGRRLATASRDRSVAVWDLATGDNVVTFPKQAITVIGVAFSPDGRLLVSANTGGEIKVSDAVTFKEVSAWHDETKYLAGVAFHPDNRRLASANWDGAVKIWEVTKTGPVAELRGHDGAAKCVAFSPDGGRLASGGSDKTIKLWDLSRPGEPVTLEGHKGDVHCLAFSPDGGRLASGSWDHTVRVWDLRERKELAKLQGHSDYVVALAFSPDGEHLASASADGSVKIWFARGGEELLTLRGHSASVSGVAFSPGGRYLATASWDGTAKIWDWNRRQGGPQLPSPGRNSQASFSPDSRRLVVATRDGLMSRHLPGQIAIWEPATGRKLRVLAERPTGFRSAVFSPNGRWIATDWENSVKLWDAETGGEVGTLAGHRAAVACVAWSPDGTRLASAGEDQTVRVWPLPGDRPRGDEAPLVLSGHGGPVTCVAFAPVGRRLASASRDGTVRVWDGKTGSEVHRLLGHVGTVTGLAFSPDGLQLASAGADQTVRVWDSATGQTLWHLPGNPPARDGWRSPAMPAEGGDTSTVMDLAYSPDGHRLATINFHGSVRLWDVATGQEAISLRRRFSQGCSVAFSPDGRFLAGGELDGSLKIWDAGEAEPRPPGFIDPRVSN